MPQMKPLAWFSMFLTLPFIIMTIMTLFYSTLHVKIQIPTPMTPQISSQWKW